MTDAKKGAPAARAAARFVICHLPLCSAVAASSPRPEPEQEREAIVSEVFSDFGLEVTAVVVRQRRWIVHKQDECWRFDTGRVARVDLRRVKKL